MPVSSHEYERLCICVLKASILPLWDYDAWIWNCSVILICFFFKFHSIVYFIKKYLSRTLFRETCVADRILHVPSFLKVVLLVYLAPKTFLKVTWLSNNLMMRSNEIDWLCLQNIVRITLDLYVLYIDCFMLICLIGWLLFSYLAFQLGSVLIIRRFSVRMFIGPSFRWFACSCRVKIVFTMLGNFVFMDSCQRF